MIERRVVKLCHEEDNDGTLQNKANSVPAAAVIRRVQALLKSGRKASAGGLLSQVWQGSPDCLKLVNEDEESKISGVEVNG